MEVKENLLAKTFGSAWRAEAIGFEPVSDTDLVALQESLAEEGEQTDPYARSATYFAMTGRHGLWKLERFGSAVLLCLHPNDDDTILVFPPRGPYGRTVLEMALRALKGNERNVRLARADSHMALPTVATADMEKVAEEMLDWRYAVHVLDTQRVSEHRGRRFQEVRTALNQMDDSRVEAVDLEPAKHGGNVRDIVEEWADDETAVRECYDRLLDLFVKLSLHGRILFYDGKASGFSIWEETEPERGLANAFAHIGLHDIRGMSRLVMVDMCRTLSERGISRVCIGGSENEGLDHFKRKFCPVESIDLCSYSVGGTFKNYPPKQDGTEAFRHAVVSLPCPAGVR